MPDTDLLDADVDEIVDCCNEFAIDLYTKLARETSGNLFFSPSSVAAALAMTLAGASGKTAEEMRAVLRFSLPDERLHEAFHRLQQSTRMGDITLRIANRLWGQRGYHFLPQFLDTTERYYGARLAEVDFREATEEARLQINQWVEEQTAQKIKDLIAPGMLDAMTRLVLTNAVYFLGRWQDEFWPEETLDAPFWTTPQDQHLVSMMRQKSLFSYAESDGLRSLELPYRRGEAIIPQLESGEIEFLDDSTVGSDMAMVVVLPLDVDGIADVEARLSLATLKEWTRFAPRNVSVGIPKFRVNADFVLGSTLTTLGMRRAFSREEADLSRMSDNPEGLFIGEVVHKAFVDVNERGTEAAAATAVLMAGCGAEPDVHKHFWANHPFLFLIQDRRTRLIHFIGRLVDPR